MTEHSHDVFHRSGAELYLESIPLSQVARDFGTPCYVYSRSAIEQAWRAYDEAFADRDHLICYAVKANGNLAVLNLLARLGSGFDIVSGGELERVLHAGGDPRRIVFSGVGKSAAEIHRALEVGILAFNVESVSELERISSIAAGLGRTARVSVRVNPDVDAETHPYISTGLRENKFGIDIAQAETVYHRAVELPNIAVTGVDCHIGSQLTRTGPLEDAVGRIAALVERLRRQGHAIEHVDIGGGLGIRYRDEAPPTPAALAEAVRDRLPADCRVLLEPGRSIVGNAGALLTRVEYVKHNDHRNFAVVDASMSELLRPALYEAWQAIEPVTVNADLVSAVYDVVGPVCETADFLGKARELAIDEGSLLAVLSAGAYGFVMSSNYNARVRPPEVLVDGDRAHLVREREPLEALWRGEHIPG
ncbi:diaminopimelate decarboxylase [Ectothiorhodospiraceae bacterium WFHF3C12]|nr:diaminopimelate decarboxylase [Ectothiorhodospiraceae bacterium WFHF3C12]